MENTVRLLQELISFRSTPGHEEAVSQFLESLFHAESCKVERIPAGASRNNLLISYGQPRIIFSAHMDVVGGSDHVFNGRLEGERVYGRGTCDSKGAIACYVQLAKTLFEQGETNFGFLFTVGQELDSIGARVCADRLHDRGIQFLIEAEPTEGKVAIAHRGCISLTLTTHGRACHSGYPQLGDDANHRLIEILSCLYAADFGSDPLLGNSTVNFGRIEGGIAQNMLSASASASGCIRTVSDNAEVLRRLRHIVGKFADIDIHREASVARLMNIPGFEPSVEGYSTDIPYYLPLRLRPVLYGPGSIHRAHTDWEYITVSELSQALVDYERIYRYLRYDHRALLSNSFEDVRVQANA